VIGYHSSRLLILSASLKSSGKVKGSAKSAPQVVSEPVRNWNEEFQLLIAQWQVCGHLWSPM
jgi:hypothetical protein